MKDPRTSVTAPFWISRLPGLRFVVCVRNPLEVAASLRARGYTSERFGLRLWEDYHRALDEAVPGGPAVVTHYDSYFVDAAAEVDRVLDLLGLDPSPALRKAAAASASVRARHQRRGLRELDASGPDASVRRLYESLCERCGPVFARARANVDSPAVPPPSPRPADPVAELVALVAAREEELAILKPLLAAREEELAALKALLTAADVERLALRRELTSVRNVVAAREEELASIRPVLAEREEELASIRSVLADREKELASIRPVLADREKEIAAVKFVLAARDEELAAVKPLLAAREEELANLKRRGDETG